MTILSSGGMKPAAAREIAETTYPAGSAAAITPNDSTDLAVTTRGLYVGTGGNVSVIFADDTVAVTLTNLAGGVVYPFRLKRVRATSTTATGLVALS